MIKTIFFDIGGVLVNVHPERTIEFIGQKANISGAVVELFKINRQKVGFTDQLQCSSS